MGGLENGNFPLLYVVKMSLRRWVGGSKNLKTPLRNIKMVPLRTDPLQVFALFLIPLLIRT